MLKKQLAIIIVAIVAVGFSLYSTLKPAPVVQSEQLVQVEDAGVVKNAEKFAAKVRELASKRSLRSLQKVCSENGVILLDGSVQTLRSFNQNGWQVEGVYNNAKRPTVYTCNITNADGQKGKMLLESKDGKHWAYFNFELDNQEKEH